MGKVTNLSLHHNIKNSTVCSSGDSASDISETGSPINALCNSLINVESKKKFRAYPERYCREFGLSLEEIHAVTDLDVIQLLKLGGDLPSLERLTSIYGMEIMELCAEQTGKSLDEVKNYLDSF